MRALQVGDYVLYKPTLRDRGETRRPSSRLRAVSNLCGCSLAPLIVTGSGKTLLANMVARIWRARLPQSYSVKSRPNIKRALEASPAIFAMIVEALKREPVGISGLSIRSLTNAKPFVRIARRTLRLKSGFSIPECTASSSAAPPLKRSIDRFLSGVCEPSAMTHSTTSSELPE